MPENKEKMKAGTKDAKDAKDAKNNQDTPKKKTKIIMIVIILIVTLLVGGAAGWYFLIKAKKTKVDGEGAEIVAEVVKLPPHFMSLANFVGNLKESNSRKAVVSFDLNVQLENVKDEETIKTFMPILRHEINMLISDFDRDSLATPEGKELFAEKIKEKINLIIEKPDYVKRAIFQTFIVK